jgi:hypothetical protein
MQAFTFTSDIGAPLFSLKALICSVAEAVMPLTCMQSEVMVHLVTLKIEIKFLLIGMLKTEIVSSGKISVGT